MRSPIVAVALVSALAFASNAFAQTTRKPTQPPPPATPQGTLDEVKREHPDWFTEPNAYVPCPNSDVFPNGRRACLSGADPSHGESNDADN
jgi:hypothetical protein